jgi:hypothetical protein
MSIKAEDELRQKARNAFWKSAKRGFYQVAKKAESAWRGTDARYYRAEKEIIRQHLDPFYWGAAVASFLFVTFRLSGSQAFARFRQKYLLQASGRSAQSTTERTGTSQSSSEWKSYLERKQETRSRASDKPSSSLAFDIFVSFLVGCSSVAWLMKPEQKLHKDFARIPLVPGRSLVHKHMCEPMDRVYTHEIDPRAFSVGEKPDEVLVTFQSFVKNCRIRSEYIRVAEREGISQPDVIPSPGLQGVTR